MKIVSIDVGIKNLAICIIEPVGSIESVGSIEPVESVESIEPDKNFNILYWNIINLSESKKSCTCYTLTKKAKKPCSNQAFFLKENEFFCKTHAKKSNYLLPETIPKYKSLKVDDLVLLCNEYGINYDSLTKNSLLNTIETYIKENGLTAIPQVNCNTINLIEIGKSIKYHLEHLGDLLSSVDYILIENQIGPIANRMNSIQGMLTQYFIMNNLNSIKYVSASNKLKHLIDKTTSYSERKKKSIEITKTILLKNKIDKTFIDFFDNHSKKDDLADSLLQALWFLRDGIKQ